MPMYYSEAEMANERAKTASLENFLLQIGAERVPSGHGWQFNQHQTEMAVGLRTQRDDARKRVHELESLIEAAGGERKPDGLFKLTLTGIDFARHRGVVQERDEMRRQRDKALDAGHARDGDLHRMKRDRDCAEGALIGAGWRRGPLTGDWRGPEAAPDGASPKPATVADQAEMARPRDPGGYTVSRVPDPITPGKVNARMIAFPVLDAIALLAVADRNSPVFAFATKAGAALGELEQAVEQWLDQRAG